MKVLVACEYSGVVRDAFRARGHEVLSCDLLPTDVEGPHYQGDVNDIIDDGWDLMVAHPPCTYLSVAGNKWLKPEFRDRFPDRPRQREEAISFFMQLANAPIPKIAIENPVGVMSTEWRKPDQYVHPYHFGDPHSKKTGLWLKNLPKLKPTNVVEPLMYEYANGKKDPLWHVHSLWDPETKAKLKLSPEDRMKLRSKTFQGFADAMAEQWG